MLTQPCISALCLPALSSLSCLLSFHFPLDSKFHGAYTRPSSPICSISSPSTSCRSFIFISNSISPSTCFILAQCVLEETASREAELGRLRERAHRLWEGQAAGKGFVHRVSQLSAQYLALSNLTKVTPVVECKQVLLLKYCT